jgi:hypothetical protein
MGMLLVVQGTATYPVRYHYDHPARTVQRVPSPATEADLVRFLCQDLGLEPGHAQHLVAEVQRWGAVSILFELAAACERLFVPFRPRSA